MSHNLTRIHLEKLSRQEIELILNENSNLTEQNLIDRYKKFMNDQ